MIAASPPRTANAKMLRRPACSKAGGAAGAPATPGSAVGCGIVFSNRDGRVWASWHHSAAPAVELGFVDEVETMMRDYLAQAAVGERLACRAEIESHDEDATRL